MTPEETYADRLARREAERVARRRQQWTARLNDEEVLTFLEPPSYDRAIVGVIRGFGGALRLCYSTKRLLDILQKDLGGASYEDAQEFFEVNIAGAYVGDSTPCFLCDDEA